MTRGLTRAQAESLAVVARYGRPGVTAGTVAARRGLGSGSASNVARVLDTLVERGLVTTRTDGRGRRRWALTQTG